MKRKILILVGVLIVSLGISDRGGASNADLRAPTGWEYEVFEYDLDLVGNIAIGQDGELYVSLESPSGGRVLRLHGGERLEVASKLDRPNGLLLRSHFLYITEEVVGGRVIRLDLRDFSQTVLAILEGPEGIDFLADGGLVVAEDLGGRVLRITESGQIEILAEGLLQPEGLAVSADGTIYIAEAKSGRVLAISSAGISVVVAGLNSPNHVAFAPDGSLWISEDGKPGRLLRYTSGGLEVILVGLMGAQGFAFGRNNEVYVAEQAHDRILLLRRRAPDLHPHLRLCSLRPPFQRSLLGSNGCARDPISVRDDQI